MQSRRTLVVGCLLMLAACGTSNSSATHVQTSRSSATSTPTHVSIVSTSSVPHAHVTSVSSTTTTTAPKNAETAASPVRTGSAARERIERLIAPVAVSAIPPVWQCIAENETGSDWHAHGQSYSSAFGVMNEAVRENTDPQTAAAILNGTATPYAQYLMALSIEQKHGFDAWAWQTRAKCGLP